MKDELKEALETKLDATEEKRPLSLLFDKMTPAKETGQIHAIVIPVPENSLDQPLIVPVCLDAPTVTDHSIAGLARLAKSVLDGAGAEDKQLEGMVEMASMLRKELSQDFLRILKCLV